MISAAALDGDRAGQTLEEGMTLASEVLTRADVMDGVADGDTDSEGENP